MLADTQGGKSGLQIGPLTFGPLDGSTPFEMTEPELEFDRLPRGFDGFRLAVVADLHLGHFVRTSFARRVLEAVAERRPELVLLCGDLVDRPRHFTDRLAAMLAELCGDIPTYAILGNHDYYTGARRLRRIIGAAGVDVLVNEHRLIRRGGGEEAIALVGLDDLERGWPDARAASAGVPEGTFTILAVHDPLMADEIAPTEKPDLMLAGHTHGGQVCVLGIPLAKGIRNWHYVAGLSRRPGFPLYVSRGLGATGVPIRFHSLSELPIVTLRSKAEQ